MSGKTLGIIGLGRIGKAVVQRAKGFRMRVLYHNRHPMELSEEERLGAHELELMKPSAYLINAS